MSRLSDFARQAGNSVEVEDDYRAINRLYMERGWGDGLPIIPPTVENVEEMLAYCDRPWHEPIGKMAPRYGEATPLRLATNAVMAGCKPQYFPLFMLAIEAMCEDPFNLYGVQATTHPCAPLVIVNGPVARELDVNCGYNAFGPGYQANATIGRAIRLALVNIGGAIPGIGDMSTFGSPAKYSYVVAENEAENPWQPLHVDRGFPREASTVTVIGAESPHNVNDHQSFTAEGILKTIAGTLATTGANDVLYTAPEPHPLVIFGPEHAKTVADDGYSKDDVRRFLYEHAQIALGKFSNENIERRFRLRDKFKNAGMDTLVPIVPRPENLLIAVIGSSGKHSAIVPTFGATQPVTRALKRRDGRLARSVEEFRTM